MSDARSLQRENVDLLRQRCIFCEQSQRLILGVSAQVFPELHVDAQKLCVEDGCIICHDDHGLESRQCLRDCGHGLWKEDKLVLKVQVPLGVPRQLVERGSKAHLAALREQRVHALVHGRLASSRHQRLHLDAARIGDDRRRHPIEVLCGIERGDGIVPKPPEVPGNISHRRTADEEHVPVPTPEGLQLRRLHCAIGILIV
mmetsp:Transcript_37453/g.107909  ORF Transcript_37453/g.107909 Transcript_37453/m.107909 type:complete len:201 (-) Transcript_37453:628-1230(-)